jgi:hypothetical protein
MSILSIVIVPFVVVVIPHAYSLRRFCCTATKIPHCSKTDCRALMTVDFGMIVRQASNAGTAFDPLPAPTQHFREEQ